ncbi:MAG: flavodoxin [Ruminococcus sp.]|nr:flavodoxin [Ruminococcus sp.]
MKAKKMISLILAGAAALTLLAGCSSDANSSGADNTQQEEQTEETEAQTDARDEADTEDAADTEGSTDGAADPAAEGGKTLVVYYSASGNTERIGNVIADAAGADVFAVEPAEPYSNEDLDYNDENSRVSVEHENPDAREVELVSATVENWESYDTVFIGYPIWWGIAAWPLDGFVKANDFSGKTVIPFCTSASSGMGESGSLLAEMAGTGEWQEGTRFQSSASEEDVRDWVAGLGF